MRWLKVQTFLKVFLALACLLGFFFLVKSQVVEYQKRQTGVAHSTAEVESMQFPLMMICPARGRKGNHSDSDQLNVTLLGNWNLNGIQMNDYFFNNITQWNTMYHGTCTLVRFNFEAQTNHSYVLNIRGSKDILLFLLNEGEQFIFKFFFMPSVPVVMTKIEENTHLKLTYKSFHHLPEKKTCKKDILFNDFYTCTQSEATKLFSELANHTCVHPLVNQYLQADFDVCANEDEEFSKASVYQLINVLASSLVDGHSGNLDNPCILPCEERSFDLEESTFTSLGTLDLNPDIPEGIKIVLLLPSNHELKKVQYLLYGFGDILAALGGALGLFLGVSFFSIGTAFVDFIWRQLFDKGGKIQGTCNSKEAFK